VDTLGNVYVKLSLYPDSAIVKLDASGHTLWTRSSPGNGFYSFIGSDATKVYVTGDYAVHALRTSDGGTAWDHPGGGTGVMSPDAGSSPIVMAGNSIERLATADGATQWSTPVTDAWSLQLINGAVVTYGPSVTRIDPVTGSTLWSTPLPSEAYRIAIGATGDHTLVSVGTISAFGAPGPLLRTIDFDTGALGTILPPPTPAQGVQGWTMLDNGPHMVGASVSIGATSPDIHLRRINSIDGSQEWETSEHAIALQTQAGYGLSPQNATMATNASSLVRYRQRQRALDYNHPGSLLPALHRRQRPFDHAERRSRILHGRTDGDVWRLLPGRG